MTTRRLNAYERRAANRAAKRRARYVVEKQQRTFQRLLEQRANEQRLKDAQEHQEEMKDGY